MNNSQLKKKLDHHYISYKKKFSSKDPVWNLYSFNDEKNIELAALITAAFAYGSVDLINAFLQRLFAVTGSNLYEFTINFSKHKDKKHLSGMYYRFNSGMDVINMFTSLNSALRLHGTLKNFFLKNYSDNDIDILPALSKFTSGLNSNITGTGKPGKNNSYYHYLFSDPANKSACKRMNLFLRWMVRKDEIDLGIWSEINTAKLIMPVDIHIARISKNLKLLRRKSVDLKFASLLTEKLKQFDPNDPVKYDFALCHLGIDKKDF